MTDELAQARRARERKQLEARRELLAEEMRQMVADAEHWNRTHPNEEPIVVDPDISKDIARLMGKG